jgi:hypothetical protein
MNSSLPRSRRHSYRGRRRRRRRSFVTLVAFVMLLGSGCKINFSTTAWMFGSGSVGVRRVASSATTNRISSYYNSFLMPVSIGTKSISDQLRQTRGQRRFSSSAFKRSSITMMPEGPEVKTLVDQLQGGYVVQKIAVRMYSTFLSLSLSLTRTLFLHTNVRSVVSVNV